jgi:hypothetical protein
MGFTSLPWSSQTKDHIILVYIISSEPSSFYVMETHETSEYPRDAVVDSKNPLALKIHAFLLHCGIEAHGYDYHLASSFVLIQTYHGGILQNLTNADGE